MPTYFMMSAEENSLMTGTAPPEAEIRAAMQGVNMQGRSFLAFARWYSPVRIDRLNPIAGRSSTKVQAVLEVDDGVDGLSKAREIGANMKQALDHAGDGLTGFNTEQWSDVTVTPFNPAMHGSLEGWHTGRSTLSETSQGFRNPLSDVFQGPNTKYIAVAVVAIAAVLLIRPIVMGASKATQSLSGRLGKKKARSNPRRRRRATR